MAKIFDLFSKRKEDSEKSSDSEVYQYDSLPIKIRNQIAMILADGVGRYHGGRLQRDSQREWDFIVEVLAREHGYRNLLGQNSYNVCMRILESDSEFDLQLDLIEIAFRVIDNVIRKLADHEREAKGIEIHPDDAIEELNYRLLRAGVGFQYEAGGLIQLDSEYLHSEVVKTSLTLLNAYEFEGAMQEFLAAHEHYRNGEHKDAIVDAAAAFESTLKSICDEMGWEYPDKGRVSDLLKAVKSNGLFPMYLDNSFDQLVALLKSGLPEIRNNSGSHGQGAVPQEVPAHIAAYALHSAAASIVFVIQCMKAIR